jgi:hypothetical protein
MNEITLSELDVELLPERNTLWGFNLFNIGSPVIVASSSSETVQALTLLSSAHSTSIQNIGVFYGF